MAVESSHQDCVSIYKESLPTSNKSSTCRLLNLRLKREFSIVEESDCTFFYSIWDSLQVFFFFYDII